jgi:hypothetical protein
MKPKIRKIALTSLALLLTAQVAFAQGFVFCGRREGTAEQRQQCELEDLFSLVYYVANYLIGMAGLVALFFVVWGGMRMMLSGGNPKAVQDGKDTIRNALIGLVMVLLSYLVVGYVAGLILPGTADPLRRIVNFITG